MKKSCTWPGLVLLLALSLAACAAQEKSAKVQDVEKGGAADKASKGERSAPAPQSQPREAAPLQARGVEAATRSAPAAESTVRIAPLKKGGDENKDFVTVPVYYGTDRNRLDPKDPNKGYGPQRGEGLQTGICEVSIPKTHKAGEMELPKWYRLEFSADPSKHIVLQNIAPFNDIGQFAENLRARLAKSPKSEIVVFVHGYMNTFDDAALRTAQIAYDLKFEGAAAFFSWPSAGQAAEYTFDENNMEWAIPHLEEYLKTLAQKTKVEKLHVVAHSMGNRLFSRALLSLRQTNPKLKLNEVILAAPDIDAGIFMRDIAPKISQAGHVTVYFSSKDAALALSNKVHGNYPRAGQGTSLEPMRGIDLVDAERVDTSLLGHSYVADNASIISDMYLLLVKGEGSPVGRCLGKNAGGWAWQVQPDKQKECVGAKISVKKP